MAQLRMIFNAAVNQLPELKLPEGFDLTIITPADFEKYNALRQSVNFSAWTPEMMEKYHAEKVLRNGHLVILEKSTGKFAASAGAECSGFPEYPMLGVLGWVMTSPDFQGMQLGKKVSIAAMHVLFAAGYRAFYLLTDDFRKAALKTYLRIGWQPWLYAEDMYDRWQAIADEFGIDYDDLKVLPEKPDFPVRVNI